MEKRKEIYIIGGPNGSGKTTFVNRYLPKYLKKSDYEEEEIFKKGLVSRKSF